MKDYTKYDVMDALELAIYAAGSQKKFAKMIGTSEAFVSDCMRGKRDPTGKLLKAVGFKVVAVYRKVTP